MKLINTFFAFLLGAGALVLTLELLRYLSERNGGDHLRAMLGGAALVIGGTVIHIVVLNAFGLIESSSDNPEHETSNGDSELSVSTATQETV